MEINESKLMTLKRSASDRLDLAEIFKEADKDKSGTKGKGGRGRVQGKGEGLRENWQKVLVLWICRGAGVSPSRVRRDEDRI